MFITVLNNHEYIKCDNEIDMVVAHSTAIHCNYHAIYFTWAVMLIARLRLAVAPCAVFATILT